MAYITRYVSGTDKLRQNAFEVRSMDGLSSGVIHCDDLLALSQWTKHVTNNIMGLTNLQVRSIELLLLRPDHYTISVTHQQIEGLGGGLQTGSPLKIQNGDQFN